MRREAIFAGHAECVGHRVLSRLHAEVDVALDDAVGPDAVESRRGRCLPRSAPTACTPSVSASWRTTGGCACAGHPR